MLITRIFDCIKANFTICSRGFYRDNSTQLAALRRCG